MSEAKNVQHSLSVLLEAVFEWMQQLVFLLVNFTHCFIPWNLVPTPWPIYERFLKLLEIPRELVWKPTLNNEWSSKKISRGVECKPKPSHSFGQDVLKEKLSHSVLRNRRNKMQSKE